VRWLSPSALLRTGVMATLAHTFGQYADRREMQQGQLFEQSYFQHSGDGDFWFDYVSDIGDGFNATYSVASLLAGDVALPDGGETLRRGQVLIMGGDQVYPYASTEAYERRTTRPYAAACPAPDNADGQTDRPWLYAIPGNHDWYDGLTAFLRIFSQEGDIGDWRTRQKRSYFALRMPRQWWLLAIDIQLDTYIDEPQLEYFRQIAAHIEEGASIIVCTAVPSWYPASGSSMARLSHFLRCSLGAKAAQVRLMLSGDKHHYSRYQREGGAEPILVTAGMGGAYMSGTHRIQERISCPAGVFSPDVDDAADEEPDTYVREGETWPSREDSCREARHVLWRLPVRNWKLLFVLGGLYGLLATAALTGAWLWVVILLAITAAGCVGLTEAKPPGRWRRQRYGAGLAALQVLPAIAMVTAFARVVDHWALPLRVLAVGAAAAVGSVLASVLLAAWFLLVARRRVNENELFAAQSIEDYKGFLRLRIRTDGSLVIYPVGIRRSVRRWREAPTPDGPRLVPAPDDPLRYELIEPAVTLSSWAAPEPAGFGATGSGAGMDSDTGDGVTGSAVTPDAQGGSS